MGKGFESQRKALQERLKKEHLAKCKTFAEEMKANAKDFRAHCLAMTKERKERTSCCKDLHLKNHAAYVG